MDLRIPQTSKQYIYAPVSSATSPTSLAVSIAIVPRDEEPEAGDFKTADWEPSTTKARILIGPGSPVVGELPAGNYRVWVKVDGPVEDPVILVPNYLVIYETP
jgi:hypothetical protein